MWFLHPSERAVGVPVGDVKKPVLQNRACCVNMLLRYRRNHTVAYSLVTCRHDTVSLPVAFSLVERC